MRKHSHCFYCGGEVEEQRLPRELRWRDKVFVLEGVPIGVCQQCGEGFLKPEVAKTIDRILHEAKQPLRTITVPVYEYEPDPA
jgi:YgiT-type zinc finger domain-containing protein